MQPVQLLCLFLVSAAAGSSADASASGQPGELKRNLRAPSNASQAGRRLMDSRCTDPMMIDQERCGGTANPETEIVCTPFDFRPNIQTHQCRTSGAQTSRLTGALESALGWAYWGSGDRQNYWVIHGCDGAGIQTDCSGDMLYIEQFGPYTATQQCDYFAQYPSHNSCDFSHPGTGSRYEFYNCGWWNFGDLDGKDWLLGPNAPYNWAAAARSKLGAAGLLKNPFVGADIQLVATTSPWTCSYDSNKEMYPFTHAQMNCYCDNEPWNGRSAVNAGASPEINWNTKLLYCGLYGDKLSCSQYDMTGAKEAGWDMYVCHGGDWAPAAGSHCW